MVIMPLHKSNSYQLVENVYSHFQIENKLSQNNFIEPSLFFVCKVITFFVVY